MQKYQSPTIKDTTADKRFRTLAMQLSLDPDNVWVGGYVEYQWAHDRYLLEQYVTPGVATLEFGCNVGATAIVLALLGTSVTAIDINPAYVELAKVNAERYGVAQLIKFLHAPDTTKLPFASESFALVTAMSVLEYVSSEQLPYVQKEIDRVIRPGGIILVTGTSSRLWPKEVHSGRWLVNYLPRRFDTLFLSNASFQRGVWPTQMYRGFGDYRNLDLQDGGETYLNAKAKMESSSWKLRLLRGANTICQSVNLTVGLCTPSISVTLQKKGERLKVEG